MKAITAASLEQRGVERFGVYGFICCFYALGKVFSPAPIPRPSDDLPR